MTGSEFNTGRGRRTVSDTVFQSSFDSVGNIFARNNQIRFQQERFAEQQRIRNLQVRNQANKQVREAFDPKVWKPLSDKVQPEINNYYNAFSEAISQGADPWEVYNNPEFSKWRGRIELMASRSNAIGEVYKQQYDMIDESENLNKETAHSLLESIVHERDFNDLTASEVANALNSPGLFDPNKAVTAMTEKIKEQVNTEEFQGTWVQDGKVLGRTESGKFRFAEDGNGNIDPSLVQHVVNQNSNIAEHFRFQAAVEEYTRINGRTPNLGLHDQHAAVQRIYEERFANDNSDAMKQRIYDGTESILKQLQQRETKNDVSSLGNLSRTILRGEQAGGANENRNNNANNNVVRDIIAPAIGYGTALDESKLDALFDPFEDVNAEYVYTGISGDVVPSAIRIKRREPNRRGGFTESVIRELPLRGDFDQQRNIAALYQVYNSLQPGRAQTTSDAYLEQLERYNEEMGLTSEDTNDLRATNRNRKQTGSTTATPATQSENTTIDLGF